MSVDPARYSLADFYIGDSEDPLVPPADFIRWRADTRWASSMYEPLLHGAAASRAELESGGDRTRPTINLASYNYLGLATHPETVAAAQAALARYGVGACGSPMLSGMTDLHRRLERSLSRFLGRDDTLLFSSGFGGALGCMAGLLRRGDVAIVDERAHLSCMDGVRLSGAKLVTFGHNDATSLDACLTRAQGARRLVVVEGVYSMDGDMAALPELLEVAETHRVGVFIDEAHSMLTCGPHGRGVIEHFAVGNRVGLQYGTFSKAFAALGGFTSGARETIDYLRCYATPYAFSAALPPAIVAAILAGLDVATRDDSMRRQLWRNAEYFRAKLADLGLDTGDSTTYVVPIIIGARREMLYDLCRQMRTRGLFLTPVDYPSVPQDRVRFRASITAAHGQADLDEALNIIEDTIVRALQPRAGRASSGPVS